MKKYNRQQLNWLIEDCYEDMEQRYDLIDYIIELQENSISKKKIEDKLLYLMKQLGEADLGDFYDEVKDIKEELLVEELGG